MIAQQYAKWLKLLYFFPFFYIAFALLYWFLYEYTGFTILGKAHIVPVLMLLLPCAYFLFVFRYVERLTDQRTAYAYGVALLFMVIALSTPFTGAYNSPHHFGLIVLIAWSAMLGYQTTAIIVGLMWLYFLTIFFEGVVDNPEQAVSITLIQSLVGLLSWSWLQKYYKKVDHNTKSLQSALHNQRIQSEAMLSAIDSGIAIVGKRGTVRHCNTAFSAMFGISEYDLVGSDYQNIAKYIKQISLNNKSESPVAVLRKAFNRKDPTTIDFLTIRQTDGTLVDATMRITPLKHIDAEARGCMIVLHDISRLSKVQHMKDEFISIASHELRTPMSVIAGYTDLLLKSKEVQQLPVKQHEKIERIQSSTRRLIDLVNDMLDLSRLESHDEKRKYTVISIDVFIGAMIEDLSEHYATKHLTLKHESMPIRIKIEEDKLRRVITNLLSNAYKFTPEGGSVIITATLKSGAVEVEVRDTGMGIPEAEQKHIFEKFSRVKEARNIEGTGLGLSICRQIVHEWEGEIWLKSTKNKGTSFFFTIPSNMIQLRKANK